MKKSLLKIAISSCLLTVLFIAFSSFISAKDAMPSSTDEILTHNESLEFIGPIDSSDFYTGDVAAEEPCGCGEYKLYWRSSNCICYDGNSIFKREQWRRWCTANGAPSGGYWHYTPVLCRTWCSYQED